jgi:peroxiredoxin Q/BCP
VSENEIYKRSDVLVVGVSSDSVEKQKAFVEKNKLPVRLLLKKQVMAG